MKVFTVLPIAVIAVDYACEYTRKPHLFIQETRIFLQIPDILLERSMVVLLSLLSHWIRCYSTQMWCCTYIRTSCWNHLWRRYPICKWWNLYRLLQYCCYKNLFMHWDARWNHNYYERRWLRVGWRWLYHWNNRDVYCNQCWDWCSKYRVSIYLYFIYHY